MCIRDSLRFGDSQLRAVQTVILLANGVQIDPQAVRQLADGNADAAGTKVIAPLDEAGHGAVPEQDVYKRQADIAYEEPLAQPE